MLSLRKIAVYKENSTNIKHLKNKAGVYILYNSKGKLVYIGHSTTNLYKTILRHFQSWNDKRRERKVYPQKGYSVKVYLTTPRDAYVLESELILKHKPRDNKTKIQTASEAKIREVERKFNSCKECKIEKVEEWQRFNYNDEGQIIDENGNIIF